MSLKETQKGAFERFFRRKNNTPENLPEDQAINNITEPAGSNTEGDIRTGGIDFYLSSEPQGLKIRIVGSRDCRTGEILPCHQEIHNTYIELRPLESEQPINL